MKKLVLILSTVLLLVSFSSSKAQSTINIGLQPAWGPTGYDHVDYYYLPDIESYYDINKRQYIYNNAGSWVATNKLPAKYANYDVYKGYKVVLNEPNPFNHFNDDKVKYAKFKGYKERQDFIKNSNDPKYYIVKGHPKYSANNKFGDKHDGILGHQNNGNGKGYDNNNGRIKNNKSDNDDERDEKSGNGKIKNKKYDNDDDRDEKSDKDKIKNRKFDNDDDRDNKSGKGKIKRNKNDNDDERENKSDIGNNKQSGNKGKGNKKD